MRVYFFASLYPVAYKPYYDAQFADFLARGHSVRIFAAGTHAGPANLKVARYQLDRLTTYFPATLRSLPATAGAVLKGAIAAARQGNAAAPAPANGQPLKASVVAAARRFAVTREPPDLCLIHGLGTAVMLPWLKQIYPKTPIAMYFHGGEVPSANPLDDDAAARAFAGVDVVFTNTDFSRQQVIGRGCPAEKTIVLPVGFDLADFQPPTPRSYRRDGRFRLLSAGRLSEEKGLQYALNAIKSLVRDGVSDLHYSIAGDGYARAELESYVAEEGLRPFVSFVGMLSAAQLTDLMGASDAVLLPSVELGNWAETQACTVQEALLMQAIAITTTIGGVPESIPQEMKPFSVPQRDAHALAQAIRTAHDLPLDALKRLGAIGREFVASHYDVRELNDRIVALTFERARQGAAAVNPRT